MTPALASACRRCLPNYGGLLCLVNGDAKPRYSYRACIIGISLGWLKSAAPDVYSMAVAELLVGTASLYDSWVIQSWPEVEWKGM